MAPATLLLTAPAVIARLVTILAGLAALVARAFLKHPTHVVHIVPLWSYLGRTGRRFGKVFFTPPPARARPRAPRPTPTHTLPRPPRAFPTTRAWLVTALRHEAVAYGSQLTHLLDQPEAVALLQATPRAQRLLRPICRYLGIMPDAIRPPPRPPKAPRAPARTRAPAPSRPHPMEGLTLPRLFVLRPRLPAPLCPRMLGKWPFNQLPHDVEV